MMLSLSAKKFSPTFHIHITLMFVVETHTYASWFIPYISVTALALGSRLRQGLARMQAKKEAQESHFMLLGVRKSARE
jgi:hypothetical protein